MISTRKINMVSDCGHYEINAELVSFKGSHWNVTMKKDGERVDYIPVLDVNALIHFEKYGCGLCQDVKLSKNTILFGALCTKRFSNELKFLNTKKIENQYYKEQRMKRAHPKRYDDGTYGMYWLDYEYNILSNTLTYKGSQIKNHPRFENLGKFEGWCARWHAWHVEKRPADN